LITKRGKQKMLHVYTQIYLQVASRCIECIMRVQQDIARRPAVARKTDRTGCQ